MRMIEILNIKRKRNLHVYSVINVSERIKSIWISIYTHLETPRCVWALRAIRVIISIFKLDLTTLITLITFDDDDDDGCI